MASISTSSDGLRTIQFVAGDGKRRSIRLGKVSARIADEVCRRVEALDSAAKAGCSVDGETAQWLAKIGDDLHGKLVAVGLADARHKANVPALGAFVDAFIAGRDDWKPNTRTTFVQTRKALVKQFGEDLPIDAVSAGDADEWAAALWKDYAPATIATFIKKARQMFRHAVRKKLLDESPFQETKVPSQVNKAREQFIDLATIATIIDAAPDAAWRCIIALARYGGLRTPSETLALKWQDVDWERNRITVFSPKLEHLPSGGIRKIPLFPELRTILEESFDAAPEGAVHVVGRYRDGKQNLRTQFLRIIRKAGVKPWGRLFHNLRGSRETELAERFPMHVVCAWIGNSERVAAKHYLQVTEAHFQSGAKSGAVAVQIPVQQASAPLRTVSQDSPEGVGVAGLCEPVRLDASACSVKDYPRQESNLPLDLRTVVCLRHTPRIISGQSADGSWQCSRRGAVPTADCRLPTADCRLPTAHCPLTKGCSGGVEPAAATVTASHAKPLQHEHHGLVSGEW